MSDPAIGRALVETLAYADVFDFPLTAPELARYLIGRSATAEEVAASLAGDACVARHAARRDGYYCLKGREAIFAVRARRAAASARVWPRAIRYGRLLAHLPFVRMVAVTGALAVDNLGERADLDYLIVTERGRLWYARAHTIAVVRCVAPLGDDICPNYFLAATALRLRDRNLFTAHELTQMVPLSGFPIYDELRRVNEWTREFLPNAAGMPPRGVVRRSGRTATTLQRAAELAGRSPAGAAFERWEMRRKVGRFTAASGGSPEAVFSADICKGHFDGHGARILARFADRRARLGSSDA